MYCVCVCVCVCVLWAFTESSCGCQSKWVCEIASFSNDIKENEFVRLLSFSNHVCVTSGLCDCFSEESNLQYPKQRHRYQSRAATTNVWFGQIAVWLIPGSPKRSRHSLRRVMKKAVSINSRSGKVGVYRKISKKNRTNVCLLCSVCSCYFSRRQQKSKTCNSSKETRILRF